MKRPLPVRCYHVIMVDIAYLMNWVKAPHVPVQFLMQELTAQIVST